MGAAIGGDILLLLSEPDAARLLADMLSRGRCVIAAESEAALSGSFSLGIVDGPALHRSWRAIGERKRADSPAFLPFLLVTRPQDVPLFARFLWTAVDELIQVPLQTSELLARVDVLLRARDASLRAHDPSLARFRAIFDSDLEGRWIAGPDGCLLVVNGRFAELLGLGSPDDAALRSWGDFIPDAEARRSFLGKLAEGGAVERTALELRTQRGGRFTGWVTAVPYSNGGATELHGAVAQGAAAAPRVRRELLAERLDAVADLAGGIAHGVNSAVGTVLGHADALLTELALDDPRRADVEEIRHAALRSADLTRHLLAFSRRQVLHAAEVRLADVALGMERTLRAMLRDDVVLTVAATADAAPVLADRSQLERALLNLVLNARDAAAGIPDAAVAIETGCDRLAEPDRTRIGAEIPAGEYAVLVVRDNGRGMDAEVRSRAFEPFFTTKRDEDALGLGLSTVYGIVKQSGGFVWLESEPGKGTTATIYLPAAGARPVASPGTVLVAEKEESVRIMAARVLRQRGYQVLEAADGAAAVTALREHGGRLDLILADATMPGVGSTELADRAGELRPGVPVLLLSGVMEPGTVRPGRGGVPHLSKPFRAGELVAAVQQAIETPRVAGT